MSTSTTTRFRRATRGKRRRVKAASEARRAAARKRPDAEDHARIIRGDRVTHFIVPVEEYEKLVMARMELELLAERDRTGVDPFDDPEVKWIDAENLFLQWAGDQIARARKARRMTQKQLAEKLGVPQSQISRIERNPDRTTVRTLKRIAQALKVDVSKLI